MNNWLYIPFLLLMAITYTRVSENVSDTQGGIFGHTSGRGPASVAEKKPTEAVSAKESDEIFACFNFNPHSVLKKCNH